MLISTTSPPKKTIQSTSDKEIRKVVLDQLKKEHKDVYPLIINEMGINHGLARIDVATVGDSFMYGYEIKSDADTLARLPKQMQEFNAIFDRMNLVVGKKHLLDAMRVIPDWWGIIVATVDYGAVSLRVIRDPENNPVQDTVSIAKLLWRNEALNILKQKNRDNGVRSKPRKFIYHRLSEVLDIEELKGTVRDTLRTSRQHWQPDLQPMLYGG